jgi:ABC-2 type transport system ATP-binding protein
MPDTVLKVEHLVKNYGDFKAVDGISFEIDKGKIVGFLDFFPNFIKFLIN